MKINIDLLKTIILGNNYNDIATTNLDSISPSIPNRERDRDRDREKEKEKDKENRERERDRDRDRENKDRDLKDKDVKDSNSNSNSNSSTTTTTTIKFNVNSKDKEDEDVTPQKPHIPFVLTSTLVPLSSSFSPSPVGSSILSSCSPIAFSPLHNSIEYDSHYNVSSPNTVTNTNTNTPVISTPTGYMSPRSPHQHHPSNGPLNSSQTSQSQTSPPPTARSSNSNSNASERYSHNTYKPPNHNRLKQRTLFEKLYTESGFASAKAWYERNTQLTDFTMGESQFVILLRHLTDFSTFHVLDMFDALDRDDIGVVGFEEFFLLVALYASRECGQTTKFLYQHSRVMFEIMAAGGDRGLNNIDNTTKNIHIDNFKNNNNNSYYYNSNNGANYNNSNTTNNNNSGINNPPNNNNNSNNNNHNNHNILNSVEELTINFHSFTKFAKILGIPEYQVLNSLERFNIVIFDQINFEMFLLYYFVILDEWDRSSYAFLKILYHDPDYAEPIVQRSGTGIANDDQAAFDYASEQAKPMFSEDFLLWIDSSTVKLDERHKGYVKDHLLEHRIVSFEIAETISEEEWQAILDKVTTRKIFLKALQEKLSRLRTPHKRPLLSRKLFNFQSNNNNTNNNSPSPGNTPRSVPSRLPSHFNFK